ncbi:MAG TPA: DUF1883 domain-containing protein [Candidatus Acidoferrum sp.]|jgi:hypothetical protein|nr:DUF1883 domain-containing protein [Candidatus Acidoferrum sp.]
MQFNSWDLGQRRAGEVVEIKLTGSAANVRLLDTANLNAFRSGRSARGVGGHATQSPVRLAIPADGRWHAVVDYGGFAGRGSASVRVL